MTELSFVAVTDEWLGPLTVRFEAGLNVLVGDPIPLGRIVEVASGLRKPRRGQVTLRAESGEGTARASQIAALLPSEELMALSSVEEALTAAIGLRRLSVDARTVLENAGLGQLAKRPPSGLDALERRAVMLALALSDGRAEAWVLYDPLASVPLVPKALILENCFAQARRKPVLVATPHWEDALLLGGRLFTFARGTLFTTPVQPSSGVSLSIRSKQARRLAGLLAAEPGVMGVVFDAERAPFEVLAKSLDPEVLAEAATRLVCEHAIQITSWVVQPSAGSGGGAPPTPGWVAR